MIKQYALILNISLGKLRISTAQPKCQEMRLFLRKRLTKYVMQLN